MKIQKIYNCFLERRMKEVADEIFHKAKVCRTNKLTGLDSAILVEQRKFLKKKSDELQNLAIEYALNGKKYSCPDYEKAITYGNIALREIDKALVWGDKI